jgi:hypothetical protein
MGCSKGLFGIGVAVAVAVQGIFCIEMHQNNIFFYFLKIIFKVSISKQYKNIKSNNF